MQVASVAAGLRRLAARLAIAVGFAVLIATAACDAATPASPTTPAPAVAVDLTVPVEPNETPRPADPLAVPRVGLSVDSGSETTPLGTPAAGVVGVVSSEVQAPTPAQVAPQVAHGEVLAQRLVATYGPGEIDGIMPRFYPDGTGLSARYAVDQFQIRYLSTDESEAPLEIVARLYVPKIDASSPLPIFVYGAGTTGLADACAPTREEPTVRNWGDYHAHMLSYAAQGYIGIIPDYAGFNDDSQMQRYFVADLEARVLLDAARAVYRLFEAPEASPVPNVTPDRAVFFSGYSQGGHAVFAVRDIASQYAPDVPIRGVIGHGATTDLAALMRDSPYFAPYLLYAFADYYGDDAVDLRQLLQPRWLATLDADLTQCIDAMPDIYGNSAGALYQPEFLDALFADALEERFPALNEVLERNNTGLVASSVPVFLPQGTADPIVTNASQEAFVAKLCDAGGLVTYQIYPDVHHFRMRQVSFVDTLDWMATIRSGGTPANVCAPLG